MIGDGFALGQVAHAGGFQAGRRAAPPLLDHAALVPDGKTHIRAGQGMAAHCLHAVCQFSGIGLKELAPGGGAEKQFFHLHRGASAARHGLELAGLAFQRVGIVLATCS